jgi:putative inorganic carbon (hco3(-)) transporter
LNRSLSLKYLYFFSIAFILINAFALTKGFFWISLIPVVLLIGYLAIIALDKLLLLVVFCTPLAINFTNLGGIGISLPTEPLMFSIMLLFIIRVFYEGGFDRKILYHPVTIAILINLAWMFITSCTSEMPVVSFKFLLSRLWFVICFYFLATQLFKKYINIKLFSWCYIISFSIVILYTLYSHMEYGFEEGPAHWVMSPFFNDHTIYGAMLAMFIPILIYDSFNKWQSGVSKIFSLITLIIFVVALIFSYTRAAWVSLAVALVVYFIFLLKIKFRTILILSITLISLFFTFKTEIIMRLEKNRQDSSTDVAQHLQSITNISSDASNLERLNRWSAAIRMFNERPVLGWGPGTYMFQYAPYQISSEKTIISTDFGDAGNAHSEYIGPLVESGVLGTITFILIGIAAIYCGARIYYRAVDKATKNLSLAVMLGLITYLVHGALNNFLDTDKASVPFWGFIAMLVSLEVYHLGKGSSMNPKSQ